ncbi:MAG: divalent-cation tolerance protein CutA [Terriglobia bacterium]
MTDKILVLVTAGNLREAKTIARRLVESRLAACVNLIQPVRSVYRWKGKLMEGREVLLMVKTRKHLFAELERAVLKSHSYTTPEILSLPVNDGSADYLEWIESSVKAPEAK